MELSEQKNFKATVYVSLKDGVLDPQGSTIQRALQSLGYSGVDSVRAGKFFEISIKATDRQTVQKKLEQMCHKLLANPVIEKYSFEVSE